MNTPRPQQTIARAAHVEGFGYWGGKDVRVQFRPAPPDSGIVFVRTDGEGPVRIPALIENRIEIPRRTTLGIGGATVEMVEHVLAALAGLQIDNCEVWVDRAEMPGCDGSAEPFVKALISAKIVAQHRPCPKRVIREVTRVGDDECWVEARPSIADGLFISYLLDYGAESVIGRQCIQLRLTPDSFRTELATARTFLMRHEAEWLKNRGLGSRVTLRDVLVFGDEGPLENKLRFDDECVRHKALDLVGDLALAGCELVGEIMAYKSGHRLNAELTRALVADEATAELCRRSA